MCVRPCNPVPLTHLIHTIHSIHLTHIIHVLHVMPLILVHVIYFMHLIHTPYTQFTSYTSCTPHHTWHTPYTYQAAYTSYTSYTSYTRCTSHIAQSLLGSRQGLLDAVPSSEKHANGHVSRNIRLSLMIVDLVQPYVQWAPRQTLTKVRRICYCIYRT